MLIVVIVLGFLAGSGSSTPAALTTDPARQGARPSAVAGRAAAARLRPTVVARGIPLATNLTFDSRGRMWVTSGAGGANPSDGVWYVPARGRPRHVASSKLRTALGLAWARGSLYVGHITTPTNGRVTRFSGFTGRGFRRRAVALDGLRVGRHTVDSIVRGPDGRLYVGVGSLRDNSGRSGRVLSFAPLGRTPRTEAVGLRNPYGLAFDGRWLLVTDNGRDDLGPFRPAEELNRFDPSGPVAHFGFPRCWNQGGAACRGTRRPFVKLPAHASSDGLAVKGRFAYVAQNGSSFKANPTGSDVQRVDLRTGERRVIWRSPIKRDPLGAAIGPDGRLYVTLFLSGKIVRFDI